MFLYQLEHIEIPFCHSLKAYTKLPVCTEGLFLSKRHFSSISSLWPVLSGNVELCVFRSQMRRTREGFFFKTFPLHFPRPLYREMSGYLARKLSATPLCSSLEVVENRGKVIDIRPLKIASWKNSWSSIASSGRCKKLWARRVKSLHKNSNATCKQKPPI